MTGVTPHGIRYPDGASKAKNLGPELQQMAEDIDTFIDDQIDEANPAFQAKAAAAVADELEAQQIVTYELPRVEDVIVAITDVDYNRTWLEADAADGGPTENAMRLLRARSPLPENVPASAPQLLAAVTDADGTRTWLEANATDGGPSSRSLELLSQYLDIGVRPPTVYVADGDSMTAGGQGPGASYPDLLAGLLGAEVRNRGISGTTMAEVGIRTGVPLRITIPTGQIPADTTSTPITVHHPGPWSGVGLPTRVYQGAVRGIPVTLTCATGTRAWTLTRQAGGTALPIASPVTFVPDPRDLIANSVHIIWGGRNNTPIDSMIPDLDATVVRLPLGVPFLVVSICNQTTEPAGHPVYEQIVDTNAQLHEKYPIQYVDLRGRLIREGLALAGLTPTAADATAIAEDRIPPALLVEDGLHLNGDGRIAAADIIYDELTIRSLA